MQCFKQIFSQVLINVTKKRNLNMEYKVIGEGDTSIQSDEREDLAEVVTCELRTTKQSKALGDKHSRQSGGGVRGQKELGKMEEFEEFEGTGLDRSEMRREQSG